MADPGKLTYGRRRRKRVLPAPPEVKAEYAEKVILRQDLAGLGATVDKLEREYKKRREEAIIAKGCHRCGGKIGDGSYRRSVELWEPCSEGSIMRTFNLCVECIGKLYDFLEGGDKIG